MGTAYFLMEPSKEHLQDGRGVTAFMMRRIGEMGVASFDTPGESDNHRRHCIWLKKDISSHNSMLYSHYINELEYFRRIELWCVSVESFVAKWNPYRVPFDIRDAYTGCNQEISRQCHQRLVIIFIFSFNAKKSSVIVIMLFRTKYQNSIEVCCIDHIC